MKKVISIILMMLCFSASYCQEKQTVTLSQLINSKGEMVSPKDPAIDRIWEFSNSEIVGRCVFKGRKSTGITESYYLSPSSSETFDQSKVGKSSSGSYLYSYNTYRDILTIWRIDSFDGSQGTMTVTKIGGTEKEVATTKVNIEKIMCFIFTGYQFI